MSLLRTGHFSRSKGFEAFDDGVHLKEECLACRNGEPM